MTTPQRIHQPEHRKHPRYHCDFRGQMEVLLPEETFTPKPLSVVSHDISATGCRVSVPGLTRDFYRLLVQRLRDVHLELDLGDLRVMQLRGRLVWVEYGNSVTFLAIAFQGLKPEQVEEVEDLLRAFEAQGRVTREDTRVRATHSFHS